MCCIIPAVQILHPFTVENIWTGLHSPILFTFLIGSTFSGALAKKNRVSMLRHAF